MLSKNRSQVLHADSHRQAELIRAINYVLLDVVAQVFVERNRVEAKLAQGFIHALMLTAMMSFLTNKTADFFLQLWAFDLVAILTDRSDKLALTRRKGGRQCGKKCRK